MADDDDMDVLDTHNLYKNYPVQIVGVICICICGKTFVACMACLVDGMVTMCSSCAGQNEHSHLN